MRKIRIVRVICAVVRVACACTVVFPASNLRVLWGLYATQQGTVVWQGRQHLMQAQTIDALW